MRILADSVGQIGLDLVVNQGQFESQLKGIEKVAAKAGKTLAAAFTTKAIIDFGKDCLELGSNLTEVQNVVDVTFPRMSAAVDEFAKSAATSFGLSETMAKKYTGTFGSMAEAFGFTEKQAYDMGTALTGLAGDVASFYNLSQDEAYTKLKSVFTGETESLKELGVVMTQAALDQYALANGFGKTTQKMTEAEKVSLRYAFVQSQLANATGDFARTSDSWANQIRILNLQFESLKATIGQGLINLFTPIVKVINAVISRVSTLANAFKAFTELITGKKSSGSGSTASAASDISAIGDAGSSAASGISDAADATGNLAKETSKAGDAAEKAAKQALGLMGFDAINKLSENSDSGSGNSGSGGSGGSGGGSDLSGDAFDYGSLAEGDTALDEVNEKFQAIIDRFKELQDLFQEGFDFGLGDTSVFQDIQDSLDSIRTSFEEIFTNPDLIDAANEWLNSLAYNLGVTAGSMVSVGATIADNLLGGLAQYLEENTDRITQYLTDMFDIGTEINDLVGDFNVAFADIFSVFRSDDAKTITSDIIQIFSDGFMGVTELAGKLGRDLIEFITKPITDNKDSIKTALENTLAPLADIFDSLAETWQYAWDTVQDVYDEHIKPLFDNITDGVSEIVGNLVDGYNTYIAPVLQKLADKFKEVVETHVKPMLDKLGDALGSVFDLLNTFWTTILQPVFSWISEHIMPVLAPIVELIGETFLNALSGLCDWMGDVFDVIKDVSDAISAAIEWVGGFIDKIKELPADVKMTITAAKDAAWNKIKEEWEKFKDSKAVKTATAAVTSAYNTVKGAWDSFKNSDAVKTVKSSVTSAYEKAKSTWDSFKSGSATKTLKSSLAKGFESARKSFNDIKSSSAVKTLKAAGQSAVDKAKKSWDSLKSKSINLKMKLNGAVDNIKGTVNAVIDSINKNIIKKIKITAPSNWPIVGGKSIGPPPNIPHLAQGGFVKANTPRLAVIGDNTQYGEIVAPENKLAAMAKQAAEQAQNGDMKQLIELLKQIIQILLALDLNTYMDGEKVTKRIIQIINDKTKNTGKCPIII